MKMIRFAQNNRVSVNSDFSYSEIMELVCQYSLMSRRLVKYKLPVIAVHCSQFLSSYKERRFPYSFSLASKMRFIFDVSPLH